jgi:uncharacterized membrane-anchored protein
VPEITVVFWIIKVLTTGIGESSSDALGQISVPLAGVVGLGGLGLGLWLQMRARTYHAPTYWFAVLMVAVFGTMAADGVHDGASISYAITTPLLAAVVGAVFWRWQHREGTLSIHSITTRRREGFYWAAVLATFALGTAAGDLTALTLHLGFLDSAFLFGALILIPAILWWRGALNPIAAFWIAYVLTRPLGASVADWLGKPASQSGLGLGDGVVSLLGLVAFAALVAYVAITKRDVQRATASHHHRAIDPAAGRLVAQPAES